MFIRFIYHWGFVWEFYDSFHFLGHFCYAFWLLGVHVRVLWDLSPLRSLLILLWLWEMNNRLLRSPQHCLFHHPIIGDMTFLHWIDIGWSLFFQFSLCLLVFSHHLFPNICSTFYSFPTSMHILGWIAFSHHSHVSSIA